jgi:hypothetical protein
MPDQSGVAIAGGSVVATGSRRHADAVEVFQVGRAESADFYHLRLPGDDSPSKSLGAWLRSRKGDARMIRLASAAACMHPFAR